MAHRLQSEEGLYTLDPVVNRRWPHPEWVDLLTIEIPEYQRVVDDRRVDRITAKFDPARVRYPIVIRRENGTLACYDGQHTLKAMINEGCRFGYVMVSEGLTRAEEAMLFAEQHDDVKPPAPMDKAFAAYTSYMHGNRDDKAVDAADYFGALADAGWRFERGAKGYPSCANGMTVGTTEGLKDVHKVYGRAGLVKTLELIGEIWPNVTSAAKPNMIRAMGHVANLYELSDEQKMRLRYYPLDVIEEKVKGQGSQFNKAKGMALYIVKEVLKDYKLRPKGALRANGKRPA